MAKFHVRDIIGMPDEAVESSLPEKHIVVFDDGEEFEAFRNETIYSYYFWKIFRPYMNTRILTKHHVKKVLKGSNVSTDTHLKLCTAIFRSIVEDNGLLLPVQKEPLLESIYKTISDAMTRLSILTEDCVTSIDILDFVNITNHPKVVEIRDMAIKNPKAIALAYDETIRLIDTEPEFRENGLAKAMRARMARPNQVNQCVMLRGYPTEVDGAIFKKPINSNYTLGLTSLYDYTADSRTAAKSHYYSDTALQDSEYMARKFQLFTTTIESIAFEDCHSDHLVTWIPEGKRYDSEGAVIYPGDLPLMAGKYYLEEGATEYKWIEGNEDHLIGKKIRIRTSLYCKHPDPHKVCHVCAGKLSENISRFSNIGHLGGVMTTKDLTQSILSIKHVNTSSTSVKIMLADHERKFMNTGVAGTGFYLNKELKRLKPKLTIVGKEAMGLIDLEMLDDIDSMSLQRISETTTAELSIDIGGRQVPNVLNLKQRNKPSMMSRELLVYLKKHGWTVDEQNNFVFDFAKWNYDDPLFLMPNKEESFVDLATAVDVLVRSNQKALQKRLIKDAPSVLLQELFRLINSKLQINIFNLEIVVYALMVEKYGSYALARGSDEPVLGIADPLIFNRSLGPAMAYQHQNETLTNPCSFFQGRRPDNPMDVFLAPKEVVEEYLGREKI